MDDSPEVIRQQMEETRASLSEKLETLEQQVVGTVKDARAAVNETVETVKGAVHDTVETVKETVDVRRQVERHPWAMLGGSIVLGYLGGRLYERLEAPSPQWAPSGINGEYSPAQYTNGSSPPQPLREELSEPESGHSLLHQFEPEIAKLKGLALGAVLGVLRDIVTAQVPDPLKPQVSDVMNGITVKLGGQPIHGQLLQST